MEQLRVPELWYFSKAAGCVPGGTYALKQLSNLHRVGTMLVTLEGLRGAVFTGMFPSVEHAFQAAKFLCLEGDARLDLAARFVVGGEYSGLAGEAVLKKGRRRAMDDMTAEGKGKVALRVQAWDAAMPQVMRACILARAAVDADFVRACQALVNQGIRIRHFARMRFYRCKTTGVLKGVDHVGPLLEEIGARPVA